MIDVSLLKPDHTEEDMKQMASFARETRCIAAFSLPAFTPYVVKFLEGDDAINVGGAVGFPSGGEMTTIKKMQTVELIKAGCTEIDMVVNVGKVKVRDDAYILNEINTVIDAAGGAPVKVIFECHYLTDDEIKRLAELCCKTEAAYIKTSTGWAPTGATPQNVRLMKSVVGDDKKVKAAGGIRDLAAVNELYDCGAVRFGVGLNSAIDIFNELDG